MSLIIKNFNKRLICLTLCICFLMPIFDSERYDSYAMDLVITPTVVALIASGLVACGVVAANNSNMQSLAYNVWDSMSHSLKTSIMAMSMAKEVVQDGVALWARQTWIDFKSSISSLFASSGGNFSINSSGNLGMPVKENYFYPSLTNGFVSLPGYQNVSYSVEKQGGGMVISYKIMFSSSAVPFEIATLADFGSQKILPYVTLLDNKRYCYLKIRNAYNSDAIELNSLFSLDSVNGKNVLIYKGSELASFPTSYTLAQCISGYLTGKVGVSIPYSVDALYYPVGANSICPDVPMDKVMALPLVNVATDVAVAVPADVVGKVTFKDIPVDIPIDPSIPVVPPVDPPVIDAKKIDWSPLMSANFSKVFPFCIPFDFVRLIKSYASAPKEPDFGININTKYLKIKYTINKDPIMLPVKFFRTFAIFAFILLLINKTRDMMKW